MVRSYVETCREAAPLKNRVVRAGRTAIFNGIRPSFAYCRCNGALIQFDGGKEEKEKRSQDQNDRLAPAPPMQSWDAGGSWLSELVEQPVLMASAPFLHIPDARGALIKFDGGEWRRKNSQTAIFNGICPLAVLRCKRALMFWYERVVRTRESHMNSIPPLFWFPEE